MNSAIEWVTALITVGIPYLRYTMVVTLLNHSSICTGAARSSTPDRGVVAATELVPEEHQDPEAAWNWWSLLSKPLADVSSIALLDWIDSPEVVEIKTMIS